MSLVEVVIAVWVVSIVVTVSAVMTGMGLRDVDRAMARQTALYLAEGTAEQDARMVAKGFAISAESGLMLRQLDGREYQIRTGLDALPDGVVHIQTTVVVTVEGITDEERVELLSLPR